MIIDWDLIRDKITPYLSNGDYYKAFSKFIKLGYKYMGMGPNVDPDNILNLWFQIVVSSNTGIIVGAMVIIQVEELQYPKDLYGF